MRTICVLEIYHCGGKDDNRYIKSLSVCRSNNDSEYYRNILQNSSDEIIANIAIILIHQTDFLLTKLFERLKNDFVKEGGIKEQMYNARINFLKNKR